MNRLLLSTFLLMLAGVLMVSGQTVVHPWSVASSGGQTATNGALTLSASVGQGAPSAPGVSGSQTLEGGYIPGLRVIAGSTSGLVQLESNGWNMVSVPYKLSDYTKTTVYPGAHSNAFYYAGAYAIALTLQNGVGYWLQYTSPTPETISGTSFLADTVTVLQSWNMIGPPSYPVLKSSIVANGTSIVSNAFGYIEGFGYLVVDTLKPGSAYWVQVSANGSLILPGGGFNAPVARHTLAASPGTAGTEKPSPLLTAEQQEAVKDFTTIRVKDAAGAERVLYYDRNGKGMDLKGYVLPPLPPDGVLDVRFASQRIVEVAAGKTVSFPVRINGGVYPLTITWNGHGPAAGDRLVATGEQGGKKEYPLAAGHPITLDDPASAASLRLFVDGAARENLPKVFALAQNYPNPFNPSSVVRYDIPKQTHVTIRVFSMLGAEVMTLFDGEREPGSYAVTLDGSALASGVYFYRLQADGTVLTKKMMLMK